MSDQDVLEIARLAFERAADAEAENRRDALDDLRFARLGEQWPARVRAEREREGRPCLTINRLPAFIRQVSDHEARCEERLIEIRRSAASMLKAIEGVKGRILMIGLALMTWALGQVWTTEMARLRTLESVAAVAQAGASAGVSTAISGAGAAISAIRPET